MRTQGYIGAVPPFSGPGMSAGLWSLNDAFMLHSQNRWHVVAGGADGILARVLSKIAANGASNAANDNRQQLGPTLPADIFRGCVLMQDGRVFLVASDGTTARIYNPTTDTLTTPTGTYPGSNAFTGGVLLPDGRVFCGPRAAGVQFMVATGDWSTTQKVFDGDILLSFLYNK